MIVNPLLFHEIVETTRLGLDRQLLALLTEHYSSDSPLYQDVCRLVKSLNLAEYPPPARADHDRSPTGDVIDTVATPQQHPEQVGSKVSTPPARLPMEIINKADVPNQPTSLKLADLQPRPAEHNETDAAHGKAPQLSISKRTLSSEPFTGISTVNVETQVTDVHRGYVPVAKKTLKARLLRYGDRVGFNRARAPAVKKDTSTHVRRASVVEEHLPTYIREQITDILVPETSNLTGLEPSDRGRFQNVLANSNSLYLNEEGATGDSYSEGDNEYILPSSLLRSGRLGLGESEEDEEDDGDDNDHDDDEYLFARQS